jgi:hypothetical protein
VTTDLGGANQTGQSAVALSNGQFLLAGIYAPHGPSQFFLARYNADGTLDAGFGTGGWVHTAFDATNNAGANSMAQLPDRTFVAGGTSGTNFALARYWGDNSPPSFALGSPTAIYVNQVYETVLKRPADAGGLAFWQGLLTQGMSRNQVIQMIAGSPEYRTRAVDDLYSSVLGRLPDPAGLQVFTGSWQRAQGLNKYSRPCSDQPSMGSMLAELTAISLVPSITMCSVVPRTRRGSRAGWPHWVTVRRGKISPRAS